MGDAVSTTMSVLPTNSTSEVPFNPLELLPKVPSLNNTYGAFLLGTFIGLMLYGLTLHQTYRYYRLFPGDLKIIRAFVITTLVLETIHTVLCMHICYFYLVLNYANPSALLNGVWSIRVSQYCRMARIAILTCMTMLQILPMSTALVIIVSECFFTRRVYLIGSKYTRAIVAITPVLMVLFMGFAVATCYEAFVTGTFARFDRDAWMTSAGFGAAIAIDALLAVTLVITLHKSRTGFKSTDTLIDLLIIYTINTGLVTGVFGMLSFVFALVWPDSLIWSACNIVATKTYANALLAVLNSRKSQTGGKVSEDCFDAGTINLSALQTSENPTVQHSTAAEPRWNAHQLQARDVVPVDVNLQPAMRRRGGDEESGHTESMETK
ncbi:hypothetical protein FKP32DRAFT_1293009 [Trametes sanguinea]|nr:hypothetical protein FKP32DRAFT_1293009 [Trametes sanguinea]